MPFPPLEKRDRGYVSKLAPGFYLNPKSQIVHYADDDGRIRSVRRRDETRLQKWNPAATTNDKPRVNEACASYSFEQAAVAQLRLSDPDGACQLLLVAISQELLLMKIKKDKASEKKISKPWMRSNSGKWQKPSVRLYDLLAGLSVRFERKAYLERVIEMIEIEDTSPEVRDVFSSRIKKWHDPESNWYKRWASKDAQPEWKS